MKSAITAAIIALLVSATSATAAFVVTSKNSKNGASGAGSAKPVWSAYWVDGGRGIAYWPEGEWLWTMRSDGTGRRRTSAPISVNGSGSASVSPFGRLVAISTVYGREYDKGVLLVRRVRANRSLARWALPGGRTDGLGTPAWSPDERRLAVAVHLYDQGGETEHLFIAERGKREARDISLRYAGERDEELPSWSPDGRRLAFYSTGPAFSDAGEPVETRLVVATRTGRRLRSVSVLDPQSIYDEARPQWSPDGRTLAFVGDASVESDVSAFRRIYTVRVDGGRPREVTTTALTKASVIPLAWSPSGRHLVFSDALGLWRVDVVTRKKRRLASLGRRTKKWSDQHVSWAPSKRVLFTYDDDVYSLLPGNRPVRIYG